MKQTPNKELAAKREFVAKQTQEAQSTGYVTVRNNRKIPVWMAFRCLYCGEYFGQGGAEAHFGMKRSEYHSERQKLKRYKRQAVCTHTTSEIR